MSSWRVWLAAPAAMGLAYIARQLWRSAGHKSHALTIEWQGAQPLQYRDSCSHVDICAAGDDTVLIAFVDCSQCCVVLGRRQGHEMEFLQESAPYARGTTPSISASAGVVLSVYKTELLPLLQLRIGTVAPGVPQVEWRTAAAGYQKGRTPCVAINGNTVIEVHCSEVWNTVYVMSGLLTDADGAPAVRWGAAVRLFPARASLWDPAVATSQQRAVVVASGRRGLMYAVGTVADGRVWWAEPGTLDLHVERGRPSLALHGDLLAVAYRATRGPRLALCRVDCTQGVVSLVHDDAYRPTASLLAATLLPERRVVAAHVLKECTGRQQLWWRTGVVVPTGDWPPLAITAAPAPAALPDSGAPVATPPGAPGAPPGAGFTFDEVQKPLGGGLEDSQLCCVCLEQQKGILVYPCGHLCLCEGCAERVTECPLCRTPVEKFIRCYV